MANDLSEPLIQTHEENIKIKACLLLLFTITLETSGTLLLKYALNNQIYFIGAYLLYFSGLTLFTFVLRDIPLSIAYTTWCSLGTIGVSIMSQIIFGEQLSYIKWLCIIGTIPCLAGLYILP